MAQVLAPSAPSVAPDTQSPDDYLRVNAPSAAFGGDVGQAILGAGKSAGDEAIQLAGIQNETGATNISTGFFRDLGTLSGQFYAKKGQDAVAAAPAYQQSVLDLRDKALGASVDPAQKQMLATDLQRQTAYTLSDVGRFVAQQTGVASVDASTSRANQMVDNAIGVRTNPAQVQELAMRGVGEIGKIGEVNGWDPDTLQDKQTKYVGQLYSGVISALASDPGPNSANQANALFQSVRGSMDATSQVRIAEMLKPKVISSNALSIANSITDGGTSGSSGPAGAVNNVTNLRTSQAAWQGKGAPYNGFETFDTPEAGVAATVKNFQTRNQQAGGNLTLGGLVGQLTPVGDGANNPTAVTAAIQAETGINANDKIPFNDPAKMAGLVRAYARTEKSAGDFAAIPDSAYTTGTQAALTGAPLPSATDNTKPPVYSAPDLDSWVTQARTMAGGDPELEDHAVAAVTRKFQQWESTTATARAALDSQLRDTNAALADGRTDVTIPEQQIRQLYPAVQANQKIQALRDQQTLGLTVSQVKYASPDSLTSMRAQLAQGVQDGDPTNLQDFGMRSAKLKAFDTAMTARTEGLNKDPASYVMNSPAVDTAYKNFQANANDPASAQAYVTASLAEQARLGVPQGKATALTVGQATNMANNIQTIDPAKGSATGALDGLKKQFGDLYPQVLHSMVTQGKMSPEYGILGGMDAPGQLTARTDVQNMLTFKAANKNGIEGIKSNIGSIAGDIDKALPGAMADFRNTTSFSTNGTAFTNNIANTVKDMAYYYASTGAAQNGQDAVDKAFDGVVGQHYDLDGTLRIPKFYGASQDGNPQPLGADKVNSATANVLGNLKADDLLVPSLPRAFLADNDKNATLQAAQSGTWVTNGKEDGVQLMGRFGTAMLPMRLKDGSPVQIKFADIQSGAASLQSKAQPWITSGETP